MVTGLQREKSILTRPDRRIMFDRRPQLTRNMSTQFRTFKLTEARVTRIHCGTCGRFGGDLSQLSRPLHTEEPVCTPVCGGTAPALLPPIVCLVPFEVFFVFGRALFCSRGTRAIGYQLYLT